MGKKHASQYANFGWLQQFGKEPCYTYKKDHGR